MSPGDTIKMGIANLHDAFLNTSLLRKKMHQSPIVDDPELFTMSDRGRFERMWTASLYVLVESWKSVQMRQAREFVTSKVDTNEVEALLRRGKEDGSLRKMKATRHYMFHRDKRKYWDVGRISVAGQLEYNERLHQTFSRVLYEAMKAITPEEERIQRE